MIQFDVHMFQMGWFNHQPAKIAIFKGSDLLGDGSNVKFHRDPKTRQKGHPKGIAFWEGKWEIPFFQGNLCWWNIVSFGQNGWCLALPSGKT